MPSVLCVLPDGFEEIETITPVDLLRRAGAEVVLASLSQDRRVTGRCRIAVVADAALEDVSSRDFDLLLIPGGPGVKVLREDGRTAALVRGQIARGRPVAAICAAPLVLADADVLRDRRVTAHFSVHAELPAASSAERVVEDGLVITSRGAGTALDFGLALVRRLFGDEKAAEVSRAIMA